MKRIFFILASLAFIPVDLASQAPAIEWQRCLGGTSDEYAWSIIETSDNGYIINGYSLSNDDNVSGNHGENDYWVTRLDSIGEIQWQKCYGGSGTDYGDNIIQTIDGGYVMSGLSTSLDGDISYNHGSGDGWIVKTDIEGNIEWEKTYGGSDGDGLGSIEQTSDGGFIAGGYSYSIDGDVIENHGNSDIWIIKLDETGNLQWQRCIGGSKYDGAGRVHQLSDGNYVVTGVTNSDDGDIIGYHGDGDLCITKLNSEGIILWSKVYGGIGSEEGNSIIETVDHGFLASAGYTSSNDGDVIGHHGELYTDYWVVKTDSVGTLEWQRCLGGSNVDYASSIIQTYDKGLVIAGASGSNDGDVTGLHGAGDFWIVKLDSMGILEWQECLGGTMSEVALSIFGTSDSGYVVTGFTSSNNGDVSGHHGEDDYWVVKLEKPCTHLLYFADVDEDGFGNSTDFIYSCYDTIGYVLDNTDCNDTVATIHAGTIDICNNIDDNCNSEIDEDASFLFWYLDADSDEFGNISFDSITCFELTGYVFDSTDCNDTNSEINPGMNEICNQVDDDCNEVIDDDLVFTLYFLDADSDNFGNAEIDSFWCAPITGFVTDSTDCDDTNSNIYPGAPEILNGLDDDCDGLTDEGLAIDDPILSAITVYPNPTEDILHIEWNGQVGVEIVIINKTGQILYISTLLSSSIEDIDVDKYAAGIYLLKINTVSGVATISFVKE